MGLNNSSGDLAESLKPAVNVLRIIVVAMAAAVLICGIVLVFLRRGGQPAIADAGLLTPVALGLAGFGLIAGRVVPAIMIRSARRQIAAGKYLLSSNAAAVGPWAQLAELGDAGKLYFAYQAKTIVAAALFEGPGFVCLIAYFIDGSQLALGVALGMLLCLVALFPSPSRVADWITGQQRLMAEEKQFAA